MKENWFASWFDTPYYHVLYKNRDESEARKFISNLIGSLSMPEGSKVLDLACGKGRHAIMLNELGYDVLGVDLSENSIQMASTHAKQGLKFDVHDMRDVVPNVKFKAVFNLFTSFGYFDELGDNQKVLNAIHSMLIEDGFLIIDFMNASKIIDELVKVEAKTVDGITFNIKRRCDGSHIYKDIEFEDKGEEYQYTEKVQALKLSDFEAMLSESNFEILRTFGDFNLAPFDVTKSDRLILIAQKK